MQYSKILCTVLVACDKKSHRSLRKDKAVSGDCQEQVSFAYDCFHRNVIQRVPETIACVHWDTNAICTRSLISS